jgi:hypothetical protein
MSDENAKEIFLFDKNDSLLGCMASKKANATKNQFLCGINETFKPQLLTGFGEINFGKQYRQGNRVYSSEHIAMTLNAQPVGNMGGYSYLYVVEE